MAKLAIIYGCHEQKNSQPAVLSILSVDAPFITMLFISNSWDIQLSINTTSIHQTYLMVISMVNLGPFYGPTIHVQNSSGIATGGDLSLWDDLSTWAANVVTAYHTETTPTTAWLVIASSNLNNQQPFQQHSQTCQ